MDTTMLFRNGHCQAVRLPKNYRMKGKRGGIKRLGLAVILYPLGKEWEVFDAGLKSFSSAFMAERDQPRRQQKRKKIF